MVQEAALAAFPFCSLGSRASTQARARFSSWIHMKHPCAACSLPACSGSCHGSGSGAHKGNRGAEPESSSRAGNTMRRKQRAGLCLLPSLPGAIHFSCLEPVSSFQEPLDLQLPLLGRQTPKPRGWILMPLQIKPAKHSGHRARAVCLQPGFKLLGAGTGGSCLFSNSWGQQWCSRSQYKQTRRGFRQCSRAHPSAAIPGVGLCSCRWKVPPALTWAVSSGLHTPNVTQRNLAEHRTFSKEGGQSTHPCQATQLGREVP